MNQIFKIGDEVIALTNPKNNRCQPRVKGNKYIVKDTLYCSKCGQQRINLGEKTGDWLSNTLICTECKTKQHTENLYWTKSSLFIKPQELQATLEQALKEENFELACTLRDINL